MSLFGDEVIDRFHQRYMTANTWTDTFWRGVRLAKCPLDLWVYQEIVHETQPDLIVETGTFIGGSALYFANLLDLIGHGSVITVELTEYAMRPPVHPRITYIRGSSTHPATVAAIAAAAAGARTMVVLDSDHSYEHVLSELWSYSDLVAPGCYLVVEDTDNDGPRQAVAEWLPGSGFEQDRSREKHLMTLYPGGWLRRTT